MARSGSFSSETHFGQLLRPTEAPMRENSLFIPRTLDLPQALAVVMGVVIGSGIFVSPVGVLKMAGSFGAALLIWAACGVFTTIGGLCYIELATLIQLSGGDYAYIFHAFGALFSFIYLWVALVIIMPAAIAVLARTFAIYLLRSIQVIDVCPDGFNLNDTYAPTLLALACLFLLIAINCYNIKWATRIQFVFVGAKLLTLLAIICIGFYNWYADVDKFNDVWSNAFEGSSTEPIDYALSFYIGIFSFSGWNTITFVTEEIITPEKNMPRAFLIGLPIITVFYITVNAAYFSSLSFDELVTSDAVAVTLGLKFHPLLGRFFSIAVMLSTIGTINGDVFVVSRLFFVGARNRALPAVFGLIQIHHKTPITALLTLGFSAGTYIFLGSSVEELVKYRSFVEVTFVGVTIACLIWLRRAWPNARRPFKVHIILPIFFMLIWAFLMGISLSHSIIESLWGFLLIATGIPMYFLMYWADKNELCRVVAINLRLLTQKLLLAAHEKHEKEEKAKKDLNRSDEATTST